MELLFWFAIWVISMPVAAAMAQARHRSAFAWFVMAFFFGPLAVAFVAIAGNAGTGWECPYCKMDVDPRATICPHCRSELGQDFQQNSPGRQDADQG